MEQVKLQRMSRHEISGESDLNGLSKGVREDGMGTFLRYKTENPWTRQIRLGDDL